MSASRQEWSRPMRQYLARMTLTDDEADRLLGEVQHQARLQILGDL